MVMQRIAGWLRGDYTFVLCTLNDIHSPIEIDWGIARSPNLSRQRSGTALNFFDSFSLASMLFAGTCGY